MTEHDGDLRPSWATAALERLEELGYRADYGNGVRGPCVAVHDDRVSGYIRLWAEGTRAFITVTASAPVEFEDGDDGQVIGDAALADILRAALDAECARGEE